MRTCHISPISIEGTSLTRERDASPSRSHINLTAKHPQQDTDITPASRHRAQILEKASRARRRGSSPFDATHNGTPKDFNAPPFLPPIIHHLSLYVKRAKTRFKPYERNGPSMWALRFAESSLTPAESNLNLMDVQIGKTQLQHSLSDLSNEAVAQAVLTKEADVEYRRLSAMAMAWQIEATDASSEDLETLVPALASSRKEELRDRTDFGVAAYSHDAASFTVADEQLNHLEKLARNHYNSGSDVVAEDCEELELPAGSGANATGSNQRYTVLDMMLFDSVINNYYISVTLQSWLAFSLLAIASQRQVQKAFNSMAYEQQDWLANIGHGSGLDGSHLQGQLEPGSNSGLAYPTTPHFAHSSSESTNQSQESFGLETPTAYQQGHSPQSVPLTDPSTSTGGPLSALNVQEQPQPHTALSLYHPQPIDHASSVDSDLWMLDAQGLDEFQPHNPGLVASFVVYADHGFRCVSPVHTLNAPDWTKFHDTSPVMPLARPLATIFLSVDVIEEAKVDAYERMVRSIVDTSFFPANEAVLKTMAENALDNAISEYSNVELVKWKTLTEGREEIQRLSEVLNRIRDEFKDISLNSVISAYSLSLPVYLRDQALLESRIAMIKDLLDTGLFLHGKMDLIGQDGLPDSRYVPFAHSGIWDLVETMLSERRYGRFICYDGIDSDNWKDRLKNVIAFLSTTRSILLYMSQLDANGLHYLDALLTDLRDVFIIDLAVLLVELINYAPLGHAFERLNLEDILGVGCGSGRGSSEVLVI
ncbi:hypothetical protein C8R48DRAFT_676690 [Suillus tomentosus]|nr:hypothetical protein C8R48DRAFT_676690 [Suillus tomentosus]